MRFATPVLLLLAACSQDYVLSQTDLVPDVPTEEPGAEPTLPTEPGSTTSVTGPEDVPPVDDCDHTSDLVYVIDRSDEGLYLFDPTTSDFQFLFTLDCTMWGQPGSMAISRDGTAYVRYSDDMVYAVDLTSGDCAPAMDTSAIGPFGMGFATDDSTTWRDRLYIANHLALAEVDTGSWTVSPLGGMPSQSELTGNADGELWAFLPLEAPAALVELDKNSGAELQRMNLPGFADPFDIDAFAFATWGGDFFLFVRTFGMGNSTDVFRVDAAGNLTTLATDTGMDVVGAGVSTCAPTE